MLKIKEGIDLKELEKYGFVEEDVYYIVTVWESTKSWYYDEERKERIYDLSKERIQVNKFNRNINYTSDFNYKNCVSKSFIYDLDLLYDLIKADLVEKVSNNE